MPAPEDPPGPLWLDHGSLQPTDFERGITDAARLGLRVDRTPSRPGEHGRVYLHHGYFEVAPRPGGERSPRFFLRFTEAAPLLSRLAAAGVEGRCSEYAGADGTWEDVWFPAPPEGVWVPTLVRRLDPPSWAPSWPPPLLRPHPLGAVSLEGVWLTVGSMERALGFYRALLGAAVSPEAWADGSGRVELALGGTARLVLVPGSGEGSLAAFEVGVSSLEDAGRWLSSRGVELEAEREGGGAWLRCGEAFGVDLRLREVRAPAPSEVP